jgi:two-component system, chemotaxis family, chemotaxis protein CheY
MRPRCCRCAVQRCDSVSAMSKIRALVLEDSRSVRTIIRTILSELGCDVVEAENGRVGLERLEAHGPFAVALVDWNMPEVDGLTFVQQVRADPRFAELRLMMVTTEIERSQVARALAAGADEYLMKPFTPEMVAEKLAILGIEVVS